jgi:hypothetical protein
MSIMRGALKWSVFKMTKNVDVNSMKIISIQEYRIVRYIYIR